MSTKVLYLPKNKFLATPPVQHRRRRQGAGGTCPPKIRKKIFSGNYYVKFGRFSGKNHVKFGNLVNFSGKHYKNWGILLTFQAKIM